MRDTSLVNSFSRASISIIPSFNGAYITSYPFVFRYSRVSFMDECSILVVIILFFMFGLSWHIPFRAQLFDSVEPLVIFTSKSVFKIFCIFCLYFFNSSVVGILKRFSSISFRTSEFIIVVAE